MSETFFVEHDMLVLVVHGVDHATVHRLDAILESEATHVAGLEVGAGCSELHIELVV